MGHKRKYKFGFSEPGGKQIPEISKNSRMEWWNINPWMNGWSDWTQKQLLLLKICLDLSHDGRERDDYYGSQHNRTLVKTKNSSFL